VVEKQTFISSPVRVAREGKWFVASCPLLDIATQGKTDKEAKENMQDLIRDFCIKIHNKTNR
jgi:predicted RNase H-like HicB family nuclease